jgi:hypothetical protein
MMGLITLPHQEQKLIETFLLSVILSYLTVSPVWGDTLQPAPIADAIIPALDEDETPIQVDFEASPPESDSSLILWDKGPFLVHIREMPEGQKSFVQLSGVLISQEVEIAATPTQSVHIKDEKSRDHPGGKMFQLELALDEALNETKIYIVDSSGSVVIQRLRLAVFSLPNRRWQGQLEIGIPAGIYSESRLGTSLTSNITGAIYQLSGTVLTYHAANKFKRAFEWRLGGSFAYMTAINGIPFPLPWTLGFYAFARNQWVVSKYQRWSPFVGVEGQELPLVQSLYGLSDSGGAYQTEIFYFIWAVLGIRQDLLLFDRDLELISQLAFSPFSPSNRTINNGGTLSHFAFKAGVKGSLFLSKGFYVGTDLSLINLIGDSQVFGFSAAAMAGVRF